MGYRFFVETPIISDRAVLVGPEAHHLQHVMRAAVGDEVVLFDGSGREYAARVDRFKRAAVELAITATHVVDRESGRIVVAGVALPKGDRQRWLIEKLVELGVSHVIPLQTERSVVHPAERSLSKLQRFVIEASKQCGRNRLMQVGPLTRFHDFLSAAPDTAMRWFADPTGDLPEGDTCRDRTAYLAVGPEGGFSPQELLVARSAGWHVVSLGTRMLRIETACVVLATLMSPEFNRVTG